jgi:hypothetical protein
MAKLKHPFALHIVTEIEERKSVNAHNIATSKQLDITEYILSEIEELAGRGFTHVDFYSYFGLSHAAWFKWLKQNPVVSERVKKGRAITLARVTSKLLELVDKGNFKAIAFYLTNRHGWRDTYVPGDDDADKPLPQNIAAISSMTSDPVEASKAYQAIMTRSVKNGGDRTH